MEAQKREVACLGSLSYWVIEGPASHHALCLLCSQRACWRGKVGNFPTYLRIRLRERRGLPEHTNTWLVSGRAVSSVSKSTNEQLDQQHLRHFLGSVLQESCSQIPPAGVTRGLQRRCSVPFIMLAGTCFSVATTFLFHLLRNATPCCLWGTFHREIFSP